MRRSQLFRLAFVLLTGSLLAAVLLCNLRRGPVPARELKLWSTRSPSSVYSPEQVVRFQLEALQAYRADQSRSLQLAAIEAVFRFASPANQRSTGPLPRFAAMLEAGPYAALLGAAKTETTLVGTCKGRFARVDVVVETPEGEKVAYAYYLSRVRVGEDQSCWVTDGVVRGEGVPELTSAKEAGWL